MAGHLPLSKKQEPEIFFVLENIKREVIGFSKILKDFSRFEVLFGKKEYKIMKLSDEYVENPETEKAFTIGPFSPHTVEDQHPSIAKDISLEVHYKVVIEDNKKIITIKEVFWVA